MYDYLDSVINLSWMYMHDKKMRPTVTNTYHHGSVFFCSVENVVVDVDSEPNLSRTCDAFGYMNH